MENLGKRVFFGNLSSEHWEQLMAGAKKANKLKINNLIKKFLPDFYYKLSLNLPNPFDYYKTKTHLILVHSGGFKTRGNIKRIIKICLFKVSGSDGVKKPIRTVFFLFFMLFLSFLAIYIAFKLLPLLIALILAQSIKK